MVVYKSIVAPIILECLVFLLLLFLLFEVVGVFLLLLRLLLLSFVYCSNMNSPKWSP